MKFDLGDSREWLLFLAQQTITPSQSNALLTLRGNLNSPASMVDFDDVVGVVCEKVTAEKTKRNKWHTVQRNVSHLITGKLSSKHAEKIEHLVRYSRSQLRFHIERQFERGMSWTNYAGNLPYRSKTKKWHIDHIVPKRSFKTPSDAPIVWALTNLRPLWERDNMAKGMKRTHLL